MAKFEKCFRSFMKYACLLFSGAIAIYCFKQFDMLLLLASDKNQWINIVCSAGYFLAGFYSVGMINLIVESYL